MGVVDHQQSAEDQPRPGDRAAHDPCRSQTRQHRRPQHDADDEQRYPRVEQHADQPFVEMVVEILPGDSLAQLRGQVRDEGAEQREDGDPSGQKGAQRTRAQGGTVNAPQWADRHRRHPGHQPEADAGGDEVDGGEYEERAPVQRVVRERTQRGTARIPGERGAFERAACAGAGTPI